MLFRSKQYAELLLEFDKILGLDIKNSEKYLQEQKELEIPQEILNLVEERKLARKNKNWELSDKIRDELLQKGYIVKDTKEGMAIEKQ